MNRQLGTGMGASSKVGSSIGQLRPSLIGSGPLKQVTRLREDMRHGRVQHYAYIDRLDPVLGFFWPQKLPQMGQSLGEAIRGFKNAMSGENDHGNPSGQQKSEHAPLAESPRDAMAAHNQALRLTSRFIQRPVFSHLRVFPEFRKT